MVTDEDIQKAWHKIHNLSLAHMKDGTYTLAVTSESNAKVPSVDLFVSRRMSKEETYQHLTETYNKIKSCPTSGKQIVKSPLLDEVSGIQKLVS